MNTLKPQAVHGSRKAGQTLVEFALVVSLMLTMLLGIMQYGLVYFVTSASANAAREGVRYGSVHASDQTGTKNYMTNHIGGLTPANMQVAITFPDGTATYGNRITVTVQYPLISLFPGFAARTYSTSATAVIEKE